MGAFKSLLVAVVLLSSGASALAADPAVETDAELVGRYDKVLAEQAAERGYPDAGTVASEIAKMQSLVSQEDRARRIRSAIESGLLDADTLR